MPTASSSGAIATFKRTDFAARTDRYSMVNGATAVPADLSDAVKGVAPVDVSGTVLGDSYVLNSAARLAEYRKYRRYFEGRHFTVEYDGGNKKVAYNFCKQIVDKRASWIAGKGFTFLSEKGNELVSAVFQNIWRSNFARGLIRKSAKVSLTEGDTFWYFTVKTKDKLGKALPKDKWHVSICPLNPAFCFPIWVEDDPGEMKAVMLQFPVSGKTAGEKMRVFTAFITPQKIRWFLDYELTKEEDNVLGLIPVVHIPNSPYGDQLFGNSCLKEI